MLNEEEGGSVTYTVVRENGSLDESLTIPIVIRDETGGRRQATVGKDYTQPVTFVKIPAGKTVAEPFTVSVINDAEAEPAEPGSTGGEYFTIALADGGNKYTARDGEPVKITDGTGWFVEKKWKEMHKPDPMRSPLHLLGEKEQVDYTQGIATQNIVTRVYWYTKWEPFSGAMVSNFWDDARNDVDLSNITVSFTSEN